MGVISPLQKTSLPAPLYAFFNFPSTLVAASQGVINAVKVDVFLTLLKKHKTNRGEDGVRPCFSTH